MIWKKKHLESTLWLCQNSYWKWLFIVDFPINSMVIFHSYICYVSLPQGIPCSLPLEVFCLPICLGDSDRKKLYHEKRPFPSNVWGIEKTWHKRTSINLNIFHTNWNHQPLLQYLVLIIYTLFIIHIYVTSRKNTSVFLMDPGLYKLTNISKKTLWKSIDPRFPYLSCQMFEKSPLRAFGQIFFGTVRHFFEATLFMHQRSAVRFVG